MFKLPQVEKQIVIASPQGLHARPASTFVKIANKYSANIAVSKDGEEVNGKSIMGIMMLAANQGSVILIRASGPDAAEAVKELEAFLTKADNASSNDTLL